VALTRATPEQTKTKRQKEQHMQGRRAVMMSLGLAAALAVSPVSATEREQRLFSEVLTDSQGQQTDPVEIRDPVGPDEPWVLSLAPAQSSGGQEGGPPEGANTGNDPRDFTSKFMPYWRYIELENEMVISDLTLFGMWAMTSKFALTYEVPIARYYDITDTALCAGLPDEPCSAPTPGGGISPAPPHLPNGLPAEGDGEETGLGDSILRLFWDGGYSVGGGAFLPGWQMTVPTATDPVLGNETLSMGPIFTFVWDIKKFPAPGAFFAMMNIFEFDVYKDPSRGDVGYYFGRWFIQTPINKKHKLYILTEMQPMYNFEADDNEFTFWIGPEFGKAFAPGPGAFRNGGALYFKPGWELNGESGSSARDWTFEIGMRVFFPAPREAWKMMQQQQGGQ
jgi:hypothetical protein